MKKNIIKVVITVLAIFVLMFAEYRYIMNHIQPSVSSHNTIYLEVFGRVDEYTYWFEDDFYENNFHDDYFDRIG